MSSCRVPPVSALVAVAAVVATLLVPAPAAQAGHGFSDVPSGQPFHDQIDWLVVEGWALPQQRWRTVTSSG